MLKPKITFITILLYLSIIILVSFIKNIDLKNEGHNYFGFQLCMFLGIENIRKEWGLKRNIDFQFYSNDFYADSVSIEINNKSLTKFYTFSFPGTMPVLNLHDVVCINSTCDTISENPYGCATGMYIRKIENETLRESWTFDLKEEIELYIKDSIIPDSIILQKSLSVFELPWSIYKSETIYSNKIVLTKEEIEFIVNKSSPSKQLE